MPFPGHICIDGCHSSALDSGWIIYGWCLGERPLRSLVVEADTGQARPAWYGIPRPDLSTAFPDQAHAGKAGFLALIGKNAQASSIPAGRWWCEDDAGRWWTLPVNWPIRTPVELACAEPAEPSTAIIEAVAAGADPEARLRMALAASRGITLRLDITNKCNLRCVMCHYQRDDVFLRPVQNVTPEQFEEWFTEVSPIVGEVMLSCADEPLVSRFFPDIVRLIRRLRPEAEIKFCTNATLMTAPIRRFLVEQQVDLIVVSIDGCTRSTFESIRTGARYDRVISHVLALDDLRRQSGSHRPEIITNFVMMQRNLHEAPPFVAMARRCGASTVDFRHVVASYEGFDLLTEQLKRTPGRYNYYRDRLLDAGNVHGVKLYLPPPFEDAAPWTPDPTEPTASLDDFDGVAAAMERDLPAMPLPLASSNPALPGWLHLPNLFADTFCARPFSEIMIREQQDVMPCPWHARPLGQLATTPKLSDVFFGEEFRKLRRQMLKPEGDEHCRDCPLKSHELPSERFS